MRAFFSAAAPARCAGIRVCCCSANAGVRPPTPHDLLPAYGCTTTPSIPDSRRPGRQPSAPFIPARSQSLALQPRHEPNRHRQTKIRTMSGPSPRPKAEPTTVLPGGSGCSCCTTSRRRTCWCRTPRRSSGSSRRQKGRLTRADARQAPSSGYAWATRRNSALLPIPPTPTPRLTSCSGAFPGQVRPQAPAGASSHSSHRCMESSIRRFA